MGAQGSVAAAELHLNAERQRCSAAIEFVFDLVWHCAENLRCEQTRPTSHCVPASTAHQHHSCACLHECNRYHPTSRIRGGGAPPAVHAPAKYQSVHCRGSSV